MSLRDIVISEIQQYRSSENRNKAHTDNLDKLRTQGRICLTQRINKKISFHIPIWPIYIYIYRTLRRVAANEFYNRLRFVQYAGIRPKHGALC